MKLDIETEWCLPNNVTDIKSDFFVIQLLVKGCIALTHSLSCSLRKIIH